MTKKNLSSKKLARLLTDSGVRSDDRKVKKWRASPAGRTIAPEAAAALDRIFGTVGVFGQFAYAPETRGTRAALSRPIEDYVTRAEHEELLRRLEKLEKGER